MKPEKVMTRDDIIRMAREAGFTVETDRIFTNQYSEDCECTDAVCRLAELVADVERRKHQTDIERWKAEAATAEKWRGLAKQYRQGDMMREPNPTEVIEPYNGDPLAATRRAIVRAAAAIGEALP